MPKPTIPPIPDDGTVPVGVRKALTAIRDILNHLVRRSSIDREQTTDRWKLSLVDADIPAAIARDSEVTAAIAALSTVYQPLDADLSAIAALATTTFGRSLLVLADAAAFTATGNTFTALLKGLAPASGGGTTNFLRADGTWAAPPGGGGLSDGDYGDITVSGSGTVMTVDSGAVAYSELSGVPSTFAPSAHATSHKLGGTDVILLHELGLPTGSVGFNGQQALSFRFENRTSDPGSPATGQVWLRTDL
jgi:hypothetical protein